MVGQRDRTPAGLDHLDDVLAAAGLRPAVPRQESDRPALVEQLRHDATVDTSPEHLNVCHPIGADLLRSCDSSHAAGHLRYPARPTMPSAPQTGFEPRGSPGD